MRSTDSMRLFMISTTLVVLLLSGCASPTRSIRFTPQDVKLIPAVAMHRALTPGSSNQVVAIRAKNLPDIAVVAGLEGDGTVVARDEQGRVSKVAIDEITEIYRVTRYDTGKTSSTKRQGSAAEAAGETLVYAPLIPVAAVSWPFLRAMGLDEHKNANDREKALVIYGGMTKPELRKAIGDPDKRYRCTRKDSANGFDVWNYAKERVLYGGQFLFFSDKDGKVIFSSFRYPSWAKCELYAQ